MKGKNEGKEGRKEGTEERKEGTNKFTSPARCSSMLQYIQMYPFPYVVCGVCMYCYIHSRKDREEVSVALSSSTCLVAPMKATHPQRQQGLMMLTMLLTVLRGLRQRHANIHIYIHISIYLACLYLYMDLSIPDISKYGHITFTYICIYIYIFIYIYTELCLSKYGHVTFKYIYIHTYIYI